MLLTGLIATYAYNTTWINNFAAVGKDEYNIHVYIYFKKN
jgi:hypothetical protein